MTDLGSVTPLPMPASLLTATDQIAPEALHAAFGRAFADYVAGPFQLPLAQWPGFLRRQGIDLALGRAVLDAPGGAVQAFALVAPRPGLARWRLATMGALPEARGSGAAAQLLQDFVVRGRAAGLAAMELEVFAQNERAVRLYRRHGFVERHVLQGWQRVAEAGGAQAPAAALAVGADAALAWLREAEACITDLPLQFGADLVAALPAGWTAWRQGRAQLVFSGDAEAGLVVRSLIDLDPAQHDAEALLRGLLAAHPGVRVSAPALQRPDLGGAALRRCGFAPEALHQFIMRRDLAGPLVRDEAPADRPAVAALITAAFRDHPFSRHDEARILQRLDEHGALTLSLVACDPASGEPIAHLAFSPVRIAGQDLGWLGLGPLAVRPDRQRQGVGRTLVEAGLARLRVVGAAGCVLLGDPAYYARFGFRAGSGLVLPGVPASHFQALRLDEARALPAGTVSYDEAFGAG
ncbi:GNAT family N-acetyltransferase [Roseateles sp.]|uniref:GNAT family N-acetyltransferase n=1 Tax=Roseateles sp. TaxID=1971397 RepID=UPI002AA2538B|nr:GNAT family N-acetyltransferase [Roseateles sp.]